jgi:hypothetical protein
MALTTHPHPAPRLIMNEVIFLLPLSALIARYEKTFTFAL